MLLHCRPSRPAGLEKFPDTVTVSSYIEIYRKKAADCLSSWTQSVLNHTEYKKVYVKKEDKEECYLSCDWGFF